MNSETTRIPRIPAAPNSIQKGTPLKHLLGAEARLPPQGSGFRGFALAHNVRSPAEVDSLLERVAGYGATVTKKGHPTDWGVYSWYFTDPDSFLWEIAHNPSFSHV